MNTIKSSPKLSGAGGRDELVERLRKAELKHKSAFRHSCVLFEQLETAKRVQIAAGNEVRRLRLELDGVKAQAPAGP